MPPNIRKPESVITVRGQREDGHFAIAVTDQGAGLDADVS